MSQTVICYGTDSDGTPNAGLMPASTLDVARYLRNVTRAEIDAHHRAGRSVRLIDEYAPNDPQSGAGAGAHDAERAVRQARAVGAPAGCALTLTDDTDAHLSNAWQPVYDYLAAAAPIIHGAGFLLEFYAGEDLLDACLDRHLIDLAWGVGATSWDHGYRSSRLARRQLPRQASYGCTVDINELYSRAGCWMPDGSSFPMHGSTDGTTNSPSTTPTERPEEDDDMITMVYANTDTPGEFWVYAAGSPAQKVPEVVARDLVNTGKTGTTAASWGRPGAFCAALPK